MEAALSSMEKKKKKERERERERAVYAVVYSFETIEAKPLPPGTSVQLAELITLT